MKLLSILAPGGEGESGPFSGAVREWNRGLDIRLRFLNIGVEEKVLDLAEAPAGGEAAAAGLVAVETAALGLRPDVAVLHGLGPVALGAAVSLAKAGVPLVRTRAGTRRGGGEGFERAADRLAAARFAHGDAERAALEAEGLPAEPWSPEAVVKAVIRLHREP